MREVRSNMYDPTLLCPKKSSPHARTSGVSMGQGKPESLQGEVGKSLPKSAQATDWPDCLLLDDMCLNACACSIGRPVEQAGAGHRRTGIHWLFTRVSQSLCRQAFQSSSYVAASLQLPYFSVWHSGCDKTQASVSRQFDM